MDRDHARSFKSDSASLCGLLRIGSVDKRRIYVLGVTYLNFAFWFRSERLLRQAQLRFSNLVTKGHSGHTNNIMIDVSDSVFEY